MNEDPGFWFWPRTRLGAQIHGSEVWSVVDSNAQVYKFNSRGCVPLSAFCRKLHGFEILPCCQWVFRPMAVMSGSDSSLKQSLVFVVLVPVLRCPRDPVCKFCRRLWCCSCSCRTQWGRIRWGRSWWSRKSADSSSPPLHLPKPTTSAWWPFLLKQKQKRILVVWTNFAV